MFILEKCSSKVFKVKILETDLRRARNSGCLVHLWRSSSRAEGCLTDNGGSGMGGGSGLEACSVVRSQLSGLKIACWNCGSEVVDLLGVSVG